MTSLGAHEGAALEAIDLHVQIGAELGGEGDRRRRQLNANRLNVIFLPHLDVKRHVLSFGELGESWSCIANTAPQR
jgi:hypothetical protein